MSLSPIHIAIADDHTLVRASLINLLNSMGRFNVFIDAESGNELLEKIATASYQPDVCIIDINMPGMNGMETMTAVKKKWPFIKTLAISFHEQEQSILSMYHHGVNGYISKSSDVQTFSTAITEVYEYGFYYPQIILKKFPKIGESVKLYTGKLLSDRETDFLRLCCSNMNYEEIGKQMNLSDRTVEKYCSRIGDLLGLHGRLSLALYAQYVGIGNFTDWHKT